MKYTNPKPVFNPNLVGAFCELDLAKGEAYMAAYSSRQLETPVRWLNRRAKLANCPAKSKAPGERYCSRAGTISAPLAHTAWSVFKHLRLQ